MRIVQALSIVLLFPVLAASQKTPAPRPVDADTARKHFMSHPDPVYPPIAKAARVQGTVEINVVIGNDGKIKEEHVLSGPAMLQQTALDAVLHWTFKPFRFNGAPVPVSATFDIPFQIDKPGEGPTKEQQEAAQAWFPTSDKCRNALKVNSSEDAMTFCKQALDLALKAGDTNSSDQLGLMLSRQYYGHAQILAGRFSEAIASENDAIAEAKKCLTETDQEYAMPFFWRAMAEANLGQADAVFSDLTMAEETHRRAIAHLPDMKRMYSQTLASILRQHAVFLDQMGRSEEAAKLRAEADGL
jgi:TonB family protein